MKAASAGPARRLASFALASVPGNERSAMTRVADAVAGLDLPPARLDRLTTAVAEATMNAIEHGNRERPELTVDIEVLLAGTDIIVTISDRGGRETGSPVPATEPELAAEEPDLHRKLAGEQGPRGWGLFLIRQMVDAINVTTQGSRHTIALVMRTGPGGQPDRGRCPGTRRQAGRGDRRDGAIGGMGRSDG